MATTHQTHHAKPTGMPGDRHNSTWQTRAPLAMRIAMEIGVATFAAFTVAPAVSIVDRAIVANASGLEPMMTSVRRSCMLLLKSPIQFCRMPAFQLVFSLYAGTYIVANTIDAACEYLERPHFWPKFAGSFVTNITLALRNDRAFTRMFGVGAPHPMSSLSLACFAMRDSMTVFSSFILPPIVLHRILEGRPNHTAQFEKRVDVTSQVMLPVAMQVLSTPLHLYGLDRYNRPCATLTWRDRWNFVKTQYPKTVTARAARILPAFGVGGLLNKGLRKDGRQWLNDHFSPQARATIASLHADARWTHEFHTSGVLPDDENLLGDDLQVVPNELLSSDLLSGHATIVGSVEASA